MSAKDPDGVSFAEARETESREREIQLLFNIVEPDPEYQPIFTSDEATLLECTGHPKNVVLARLEYYLQIDCSFATTLPVWQVVDELRKRLPGWPDASEPELQ